MINIIPYKQKKTIRRLRYLRIINSIVAASIILLTIASILFLPTVLTINSRYLLAEQQLKRLEDSGEVVKNDDIVKLQKRVKSVKDKFASSTPPSPMDYVDKIRASVPSSIKITGYDMSTSSNIVQIRGVAKTRESIQDFIVSLQGIDSVDHLDSPVANYLKSTESEFFVTITFKKP